MNRNKREQAEFDKLYELYKGIPANKLKLVEGLIDQAARLKISLDDLWEDILENGNTETFEQGSDSFERERPNSKIFTQRDKSYQSIIKQLDAMLPPEKPKGKLEELLNDDD